MVANQKDDNFDPKREDSAAWRSGQVREMPGHRGIEG